jgi:hypothetical protein
MNETEAIAKAKEFLDDVADAPSEQLIEQLLDARVCYHPDKFRDPDAIKEAAENFKILGTVIEVLRASLERRRATRGSAQLARVQDSDQISLRAEVLQAKAARNDALETQAALRGKVEALENSTSVLERQKAQLETKLRKRRRQRAILIREKLTAKYQVTKGAKTGVVVATVLLTAYVSLAQVENRLGKLVAPIGLSPSIFGMLLFVCFLATILVAGFQGIRKTQFANALANLCTTGAVARFAKHIGSDTREEFSDSDVTSFIHGEVAETSRIDRALRRSLLRQSHAADLDEMKQLFIAHLIENELAEVKNVDRFNHIFRVRTKSKYDLDFDFESLLDDEVGGPPTPDRAI